LKHVEITYFEISFLQGRKLPSDPLKANIKILSIFQLEFSEFHQVDGLA
jgi:hypothetical protein